MYTQCPHCETIFVLTQAQLDARAGRVRCGQCQQVFRGDQYMFDTLPVRVAGDAAADGDDTRSTQSHAQPRHFAAAPADDFMEDSRIPTVADLAWLQAQAQRPRPRRLVWGLASLLMILVALAQYAYFERATLLQRPTLHAYLTRACDAIGCTVPLASDVAQLELVDVDVAPHPEFAQALTVTGVLVNHAAFAQRLPRLEVSFSDAQGVTLARRLFDAEAYAPQPVHKLAPRERIPVKLELTKPAADAVGYEIELVRAANLNITFFLIYADVLATPQHRFSPLDTRFCPVAF